MASQVARISGLADRENFVHILAAMNSPARQMRGLLAWFALAAYVLLGGNTTAGIVACFGLDGHVATERSHIAANAATTTSGVEFASTGHGPCIDIGLENPVNAAVKKIQLRANSGLAPVVWEKPTFLVPAATLLLGVVWPAAPPSAGARLEFAETVRLLI